MAKLSMRQRELKREKKIARYHEKRDALRAIMKSETASPEGKWDAQTQLQKMPRDSSPTRHTRRCQVTGRPHAVYRKFQLSRIMLREAAMRGDIPGLKKASW